jgi:hypothetical protein
MMDSLEVACAYNGSSMHDDAGVHYVVKLSNVHARVVQCKEFLEAYPHAICLQPPPKSSGRWA